MVLTLPRLSRIKVADWDVYMFNKYGNKKSTEETNE